jgi:general secretion pathway protein C
MLVAASAFFWGSRLLATPSAAPASSAAPSALLPVHDDFTRLLGEPDVTTPAAPEPSPAASRFVLNGVVASTEEADSGIALIAVDGQKPRAFRTGESVGAGFRLDKVSHRSAVVLADDGTPPVVLELAPPDVVLARSQQQQQPLPGATAPAGPNQPIQAGVPTASSGPDPDPPLEPAVDLVQEASARPSGSAPNTASPGRRKRLRGLAH